MKTIKAIILSAFLPISAISLASEATPDTLMVVDSPSRVVITESPEGTKLQLTDSVSGNQKTLLVEYSSGSKVSTSQSTSSSIIFRLPGMDCGESGDGCIWGKNGWVLAMDGLCVGLNNANGQTGGGGLQWSKSFEISWLSCLNVGYVFSRSRVYIGLGLDWRNYKTTLDGRWLQPSVSKGVEWGTAPEGASVKTSNLKVFSLQMPLMYVWNVPKTAMRLRVGPILNFNTYSSIKGNYDDAAGNRCEYFTKNFDRNPVTVDFFGSISYHDVIGVYVRYSPMKVLKDPSPINFNPFTVGFSFLM